MSAGREEERQGADEERMKGVDIVGRHAGKKLVRRTVWVTLATLLSRILGFVREMISAFLFGDHSPIYDAFITAWRIPNLFRRLLGEGALATSLQRALTAADADHGEESGRALFQRTVGLMIGVLLTLNVVLAAAALMLPDQIMGYAWLGKDPEPVRELVLLLSPFVVLICTAALAHGALNVRGHYAAPNLSPIVLNLGWIATLVWVGAHHGRVDQEAGSSAEQMQMARTLSIGVLLSGALQFVVILPALVRTGLLGRVSARARRAGDGAWAVLRQSAPLAFGAAVYQINVLVDGLMAEGLLPDGGPTAHYYANRVQQFPLALIAVAATSSIFPALAALGHRGERQALKVLHDRTQAIVFALALPASLGLFVLAPAVVQVCFGHGAFGPEGVRRTTSALVFLCAAVPAAGAAGLAVRAFYALSDYRFPVRVSCICLIANVLLGGVFLIGYGMDVGGLALATALSSWLQFGLLLRGLSRRHKLAPSRLDWRLFGAALLAAGASAGAARLSFGGLTQAGLGAGGALGAAILVGLSIYSAMAWKLGLLRALSDLRSTGRRQH